MPYKLDIEDRVFYEQEFSVLSNFSAFQLWQHPYMARGDFMFGGMAVVISDVPKKHVGDKIVPRHPVVRWLARFRFLRVSAFLPGAKIEEEQVLQAAGKLFMSPAAWEEFKSMRQKSDFE